MVNSYTDVAKKIVASDAYQTILSELQEKLSIPLEESYESMLAEFDGESLSVSQLNESDIVTVLHTEAQQIKAYSEKKFRATDGALEAQDYPFGEEPEIDDDIGNLNEGVYSQGFLLKNIIEYLVAKKGVKYLESYLKIERIPNAKAYARQILTFI
jgi:hypothetical protein